LAVVEWLTSAASIDRGYGTAPSLCTNEDCRMSYFARPNNDALEKLLTEMFPNVALSSVGVALLAAQIRGLEKRCATIHHRIDPKRPEGKRQGSTAAMPGRRFN
jgi:hypothetical protein